MSSGTIGEIRLFAGNFAPRNWAFCSGQLLSIAQNTALFSILGTTYGGNGTTTFALPDLRGRVPVHAAQGPGLPSYVLGQAGGAATVTLSVPQIPSHVHALEAGGAPNTNDPSGAALPLGTSRIYSAGSSPATPMHGASIGPTGGSQPHENMPPYLALNYVICMFGIFPSRN